MDLRTSDGKMVKAGNVLAGGGQGDVYDVQGRKDVVFKRYHTGELIKDVELPDRLALMTARRPSGWRELKSQHVLLTWPNDVVRENGQFVGYLMPRIDPGRSARLLRVTDPSDRSTAEGEAGWLRAFTWKYLATVATNLTRAVEALHDANVVIGDFNDANVAVTKEARVTLYDCDSMQIEDPATGRKFLCRVFRPDFLAPELVGTDLKTTVRPRSSDLFALAVHIHQLLLEGEHPFRGRWEGVGDPPMEPVLGRKGLWTHAGSPEISPRPSAIGIDLLPNEIVELFHRAFVEGATVPRMRPMASEWGAALEELTRSLKRCKADFQHWYPAKHRRCPWCARAGVVASRPRLQKGLPALMTPSVAAGPKIISTPTARPPTRAVPSTPSASKPSKRVVPPTSAPARVPVTGVGESRRTGRRLIRAILAIAVLAGGYFLFRYLTAPALDSPAVSMAATTDGHGYWIVSSKGSVYAYGDAARFGGAASCSCSIVAMAVTSDGKGYWLLSASGGVFAYGDASYSGSLQSIGVSDTTVGIAPTRDGKGYSLVGFTGAVYAFGDAKYQGSPNQFTSTFVTGIAPDTQTGGYWTVGADGSVFGFNAPYLGGANGQQLNGLVNGISAVASGGYRLTGKDGGVFSYGSQYFGSLVGNNLPSSLAGIAGTPSGAGYWLLTGNGQVTGYGDATVYGHP
jgi:hypothetical protein